MKSIINTKELRASLGEVVERVRRGARFTVIHRSVPAFRIVPVDDPPAPLPSLDTDSLYRSGPVGRSTASRGAANHDDVLYRRS